MKTILITGANRGIGLEMVNQYLLDGWKVIACCRNPNQAENLKKLAHSSSHLVMTQLEVGNPTEITELGKKFSHEPIDILINNAGIFPSESLWEADIQTWQHTLLINTIAPCLIIKSFLSSILQGKQKIIANVSSGMGSITLSTESSHPTYRVSKTGLNALTKCLANALKEQDVKVIAIDPGWVKTDMGGVNAKISAATSVTGIRQVLTSLTLNQTGCFIRYDGSTVPW